MKCLNCSFENPVHAKFCQSCGKPLEKKCPNCNTSNSGSAYFCMNCGFNLAETRKLARDLNRFEEAGTALLDVEKVAAAYDTKPIHWRILASLAKF